MNMGVIMSSHTEQHVKRTENISPEIVSDTRYYNALVR